MQDNLGISLGWVANVTGSCFTSRHVVELGGSYSREEVLPEDNLPVTRKVDCLVELCQSINKTTSYFRLGKMTHYS